jgi:AcrR family transcriptional regulator
MHADPTSPPRRRRKQHRPPEILAAALHSFAQRGFAATRMDEIARAAGIGKGTLYLYYPTKEDLFRALVRDMISTRLDAATLTIAGFEGPTPDLLRALGALFLSVIDSDISAIPKLVLTEAGNFPAIASFYAEEVITRAHALLTAVLARGIARNEFRDIGEGVFTPLFVGPLLMLALWKHSLAPHSKLTFDTANIVTAHIDVLLHGITRPPA